MGLKRAYRPSPDEVLKGLRGVLPDYQGRFPDDHAAPNMRSFNFGHNGRVPAGMYVHEGTGTDLGDSDGVGSLLESGLLEPPVSTLALALLLHQIRPTRIINLQTPSSGTTGTQTQEEDHGRVARRIPIREDRAQSSRLERAAADGRAALLSSIIGNLMSDHSEPERVVVRVIGNENTPPAGMASERPQTSPEMPLVQRVTGPMENSLMINANGGYINLSEREEEDTQFFTSIEPVTRDSFHDRYAVYEPVVAQEANVFRRFPLARRAGARNRTNEFEAASRPGNHDEVSGYR
jgi:hypothetical protein